MAGFSFDKAISRSRHWPTLHQRRSATGSASSAARATFKRVRAALAAKNAGKAGEALREAVRIIDMAAQKGVIPRKTASRKISRLTRAVAREAKPAS
jgi:small subunit ribosomal protein S20